MNDWFPLCLPTAVVEYLQITIVNFLTTHNRQKMTEKRRSVNNVRWRVVAGRIRRGRGPDSAGGRGPFPKTVTYFMQLK